MIRFQYTNFNEMKKEDCSIRKKSADWFVGNGGGESSNKELKKLPSCNGFWRNEKHTERVNEALKYKWRKEAAAAQTIHQT